MKTKVKSKISTKIMEKENKKAINLAYDEIDEVRASLISLNSKYKHHTKPKIIIKELLDHCLTKNDRLGTALDSLEKYTSDDLSNLK